MDKWVGKVAVVTGASSGIGVAIAKRLVAEGMQVVGLARRIDRMQELATEISSGEGKFHPMECDLYNEENIASTFEDIKTMLGGIDVMINNAGMAPPTSTLMDQEMDVHRKVLDLNVIALTSCTQKAMTSMMERDINGQIIHINSIYGHIVPMSRTLPSMYIASKHAVTALTETLRQQLILMNDLSIKVTVSIFRKLTSNPLATA